jgi:hypothetical protein
MEAKEQVGKHSEVTAEVLGTNTQLPTEDERNSNPSETQSKCHPFPNPDKRLTQDIQFGDGESVLLLLLSVRCGNIKKVQTCRRFKRK